MFVEIKYSSVYMLFTEASRISDCVLKACFVFNVIYLFIGRAACGILVLRPGIEPQPSAVKAQSPNHWTAREFPLNFTILYIYCGKCDVTAETKPSS